MGYIVVFESPVNSHRFMTIRSALLSACFPSHLWHCCVVYPPNVLQYVTGFPRVTPYVTFDMFCVILCAARRSDSLLIPRNTRAVINVVFMAIFAVGCLFACLFFFCMLFAQTSIRRFVCDISFSRSRESCCRENDTADSETSRLRKVLWGGGEYVGVYAPDYTCRFYSSRNTARPVLTVK